MLLNRQSLTLWHPSPRPTAARSRRGDRTVRAGARRRVVNTRSLSWRRIRNAIYQFAGGIGQSLTPETWAGKFESFERINSIRVTNGNFDSSNSCERLVPSRLHELLKSKCPFVTRIEFIRSKLSNCSARVSGVAVSTSSLWPSPATPDAHSRAIRRGRRMWRGWRWPTDWQRLKTELKTFRR